MHNYFCKQFLKKLYLIYFSGHFDCSTFIYIDMMVFNDFYKEDYKNHEVDENKNLKHIFFPKLLK